VAFAVQVEGVRVGIYTRISSDRDGDQLGVKRQMLDCERLAELRGFVVVERYIEDDTSAWSRSPRPEYDRMLADLRAGWIRGVVAWDLDRLHRRPREFEAFLDLCDEIRIEAVACVTTSVDLGQPAGRWMARSLTGMASYESDHKSERIRRKHQELAVAGKVSGGGHRPFGYDGDKITLRPSEAAIVRDCAERFLAGESLRQLASDLNARGIATSTGGQWVQGSLRRMLASARISGQREHHGEVVGKAEWPAIISPAQSAQIRAILADPSRRTNQAPRRYLLHGLLTCSHCGERLVARPRAGGQRRYACASGPGFSGCGKTYINADQAEHFISEAVLHRIDSPEIAAGVNGRPVNPDVERLQAQLEADQEQLRELGEAHGNKQISLQQMLAANRPIEARITETRRQLSRVRRTQVLDRYLGQSGQLRSDWESLDLDRQHAIVAAVLDHAVVGPGRRGYNRFDESRLAPFWRA
jgi:site-specific DNA recombinase